MALKTMKAAIVQNHGENFTISIDDRPMPEPVEGELLVKLNVTGLCLSDVHLMLGAWSHFHTTVDIPGHEGAGVVTKLGSKVTDWKIGDRIGVKACLTWCRICEQCLNDRESHCPNARRTGVTISGTYQQYICVPADYGTRLPDDVDDYVAGPVMCAGTTSYRCMRESGLKFGDWVAFPGAGGGVGHMSLQVAKAMGCRCIAIDSGKAKGDLCKSLGAEVYIDISTCEDLPQEVRRITNGGAHGIVVTASHPSAYASAPEYLAPTGKVIAGADPNIIVSKAITVKGTRMGSSNDCNQALDLASRNLLRPVYERFKLYDLPRAINLLQNGKIAGRAVVDLHDES